ncbi:hypothetical protein A4D02_08880 [Niastella koreensis]|uniref:DUF4132 domain-containing protein n=2 Tax=Niastella koreensis TaxID=354356 RepID=G8TQA5_NIAKG|nr:DUF4132 domain-containing protein [Niastella koreensis]AEW02119.1 hypothetical protein Niako_5889 [Niastella koreensis GR20-10]OQP48805.1 hypothetical protein A4D02_08880 [Niastella koreensis]
MAFTVEQLRPFNEHITPGYKSQDVKNNIVLVNDYLTGKTNTLTGLANAYDNYYFKDLTMLLQLPQQWNHNDQLALNVITAPEIWLNVMQSFIIRMAQQVDATGTEQDWNTLLAFLQNHVTLLEVFHFILNSFKDQFGEEKVHPHAIQLKWLKEYLGAADKNTLTALIKHYSGVYDQYSKSGFHLNFLELLMECLPAEVDEYFQSNIDDGQLFNFPAIDQALKYNGEKYLAYIIERIKTHLGYIKHRANVENRFYALVILQDKYPGSVNDLLIAVSNDYLSLYPEINKSGWERQINDGKGMYVMSTLAAKILMEADTVSTKEKLWDLIQQTNYLQQTVLNLLVNTFQAESLPFLLKAMKASVDGITYHEHVLGLIKRFDSEKHNEALWDLVLHKSKQLRQLAVEKLGDAENALEKSKALLSHKKTDVRQAAAQILSLLPSPEAKAVLRKAIGSEKNDDARDVMVLAVAEELYANIDDNMLAQVVADARERGKLAAPLEAWLNEVDLPALYYSTGTQLTNDEVRFLLYRMGRVKTMRSDLEARLIINRLDIEKSAGFALQLIKLFIEKETKPEHKYLLALSALLGNDAVADKIRITIDKWIDNSRFKMAEYGVGALALQGSNKALRWVELYSRKYKTKKANVGAAALLALEAAAEELNITVYELGDRIVPDFGFEGLFREFTVDGDNYRAFIDSNFKIAFFNDDNKKLKAIPASAANELKDEFKAIAKEVKDIVKSQSSRLEHYLVVQRRWNKEQWQQFFLTNPVMFIYATKLLWGVYDNNELKQCFYCQEDTTLMDADDNEISLEENAQIGIVHPLQLSAEALKTWQRKFFDLSIEPVFSQLDRNIHSLVPEQKEVTIVRTFDGTKTEPGSIRGTLEKYGWRKGPTGDGGSVDTFFKDEDASELMAVLEVEGVNVAGFDADMNAQLGRLYFRQRVGKNKWITPPKDDKDPVLIPLGKLPEVFYSEVISAIKAIKVR